ncbi:MAG: exodeoxyribonuclease VII small subunit [Treponema sp.]|nr:exodeoxyribonuclease VII small subunit [Treponema sp.]
MTNFEGNLEKLEKLTADIKRSDISLEEALKDFEEGIKLARGMEKELDSIEGKIQQLMNQPDPVNNIEAEMENFTGLTDGSAGAPLQGTRQ